MGAQITIGALIVPQNGEFARMHEAWLEAEELGVDRLYTADHFFVPRREDYETQHRAAAGLSPSPAKPPAQVESSAPSDPEPYTWESTTIEAAMCATTTRPEVACLVHCNAYRNPNLLADMVRTMDHLSGGRFVLGIGAGFYQRDFDEYGYEFGTFGSRLRDLDRDLDIVKARWPRLNPPPVRKVPILMAGGGEQLALRIVAKHADEWHWFAESVDALRQKSAVLDERCAELGRDPKEIRRLGSLRYGASIIDHADDFVASGFTHLIGRSVGPDWDLTEVRKLISWRDSLD